MNTVVMLDRENHITEGILQARLPGFEEESCHTLADNWQEVYKDVSAEILWQGGWADVAKALARELESNFESGSAEIDQERKESGAFRLAVTSDPYRVGNTTSLRGKFKPVDSIWDCFDYPFYVVARRVRTGKIICRLMRRLY